MQSSEKRTPGRHLVIVSSATYMPPGSTRQSTSASRHVAQKYTGRPLARGSLLNAFNTVYAEINAQEYM